jgi:hypothetical protein
LERLAREAERMAREGRQPKRTQETAERLRDLAREMMKDATPEQQERVRQLLRELDQGQIGGGGPSLEEAPRIARKPPPAATGEQAVPVDARRPPREQGSERVIAEWYSNQSVGRGGPAGTQATEAIRQAAESADRAVEQQLVPARHSELVRRVFRRFAEQQSPARE